MTLPSAPPTTSARPAQNRRLPGLRTISVPHTSAATRAKTMKSGVCQPCASARKLNAAPLLQTSTRLKKPVSSTRGSRPAKKPSTAHLASWSAAMIAADSANHLYMPARLARALQVALAAPAQAFAVHIRQVVPAALALRVAARRHAGFAALAHPRARGEQQELELVAQAREQLVIRPLGGQLHLGLQRRADLAFTSERFQLLAHGSAQFPKARPLGDQRSAVRHLGQRLPGLEEDAVIGLAAEVLPQFLG